jgi:hypothetical protein
MNIQAALLPHKHVKFSASLIAVAGYVRGYLSEPRTVDELWSLIESNKQHTKIKPTFTQLVLAVDILFAIQQVTANSDGRIISSALTQGNPLCD